MGTYTCVSKHVYRCMVYSELRVFTGSEAAPAKSDFPNGSMSGRQLDDFIQAATAEPDVAHDLKCQSNSDGPSKELQKTARLEGVEESVKEEVEEEGY